MQTLASDSIEVAVMRLLCKRFRSAYATKVLKSLDNGKHYLALEIEPSCYTDAALFSKDYLLYSFLRKWKGWDCGIDQEKAAIDGWTAAEQRDFSTNRRFADVSSLEHRALDIISGIQRKIQDVIGAAPDHAALSHLCKWGPGATQDLRRSDGTDAPTKMSSFITCTKRCAPHFLAVIDPIWREVWGASEPDLRIVAGNRCVCVPKNAKTHRMIAAEPTANSFMQQAVGRYFRSRLRAFGVNLDDQTVNQDMAFHAYVDGLATIDLSSASDTICSNLVSLLLPVDWYEYLSDLRSPVSTLQGKDYLLEKFSAMGNAFTFELESLIFWAISKTIVQRTGGGQVSVYGDDIIVPQKCAADVMAGLRFFGFVPNSEKSFTSGPFFESCGKQYHSLEDVTPPYQKEVVGRQLTELIRMHNRLFRWGTRNSMNLVRDALLYIVKITREFHPKLTDRLPRIPDSSVEDSGFLTDPRVLTSTKNADYLCWVLESYTSANYGIRDVEQLCAYAYKLRRPVQSNLLPDGHYGVDTGDRTRLRKRVIWRSSLG